ncbi:MULTISPECIES: PqqD family peptide modification chaperone [Spirosoma]|uniref:PqqD family protein n=1 Tax=Spirosoma sordidisoli TaxID=2502893 RepID=A0A4V1RWS8_9BACT|nr:MULTISPECIES: PqqD family peptide modification chaperone [Spirosoma]RYC71318.1 PqqD family protein [Spirosoma sordidisoli]
MVFEPTTCIQLTRDQSSSALGTETIVLNYKKGNYYELNEVGGFIWSLLQTRQVLSVQKIKDQVLDEFDVDEFICQQELLFFIGNLFDENLIETTA